MHLFKNRPAADRLAVSAAELIVLFGAIGLVSGPLWGRKAWGVWWQWDARLTMALLLELIFIAYLLVRAYGGPGIGQAGRGRRTVRNGGLAVRVYVREHLADDSPAEHRGSVAEAGDVRSVLVLLRRVSCCCSCILLQLRTTLAKQQATLDDLYLAADEGTA